MVVQVQAEALGFWREAHRLIEAVRSVVALALVGQQLDFPAGCSACVREGLLQQQCGYTSAAVSIFDDHGFDEGC
jgi:hypothetical protein